MSETKHTAEANAHLIAAAPAIVEKARAVVGYFGEGQPLFTTRKNGDIEATNLGNAIAYLADELAKLDRVTRDEKV